MKFYETLKWSENSSLFYSFLIKLITVYITVSVGGCAHKMCPRGNKSCIKMVPCKGILYSGCKFRSAYACFPQWASPLFVLGWLKEAALPLLMVQFLGLLLWCWWWFLVWWAVKLLSIRFCPQGVWQIDTECSSLPPSCVVNWNGKNLMRFEYFCVLCWCLRYYCITINHLLWSWRPFGLVIVRINVSDMGKHYLA